MLAESLSADDPASLSDYMSGLAPLAIADVLGFSEDEAVQAAGWTKAFVRAIAPGAGRDDVERGISASGALDAAVRRHAENQDDVVIANAIGFFSQSYDATAGLLGNTLVALASTAARYRDAAADPAVLRSVIEEVARFDAPVQNTRRYAAADTMVMGSLVRVGQTVLVVLAAANRDPSANPHPAHFDAHRVDRRTYTFGLGAHACPGARTATMIAQAGVAQLLKRGLDLQQLTVTGYRTSLNARIPEFRTLAVTRVSRSLACDVTR